MAEILTKFKIIRNIILGVFILLIIVGVKLELFEGKRYYRLSEENRIKKKYIPAPRGKILDRNGREIANTRPGYYLSVIPQIVDKETLRKIAEIFSRPESLITEKMRLEKNPFIPVKLLHDIDFDKLSIIEENLEGMDGVEIGVEPLRNYPYRELFCHLIGYVGEISMAQVGENGYKIGDYKGKMGLEGQYEEDLRGRDGIEYIEVDARGKEIGRILERRPVPLEPGKKLITTLDLALTESTSVFLKDYERATCVCLNPKNGEILVLYSKPGFDPNLFIHGIKLQQWQNLLNATDAPMFNRAIMSCYPPGSSFKPFVALAGLNSKMIKKEKRFEPCYGRYRLGNRIFRCWKSHHSLDLVGAIINSCDIYFYQLGQFLGIDTISLYCKKVGFGELTQIDLPQEKCGILPDRRWFESRYGKNWTAGHILNLSIGQGDLLVTPLQLACAYTLFVNKGRIPLPHIIKNKEILYRQTDISDEAIEIVGSALQGVVSLGTGRLAHLHNIEVCGKTGTAQNPHGQDHALFVGYAPAQDPEILVCVVVENAGHGGSVAAPIASKLIKLYLSK